MRNEIVRYYFYLNPIFELIKNNRFKTITFFLDISSISRGIYSSKIISNSFLLNYKNVWFDEIINCIEWLKNKFKKYDPLFILFYDKGVYSYHLEIYPEYKSNRNEYGIITKNKYFSIDLKHGIQYLKNYTFEKLLELNKFDDIISVYLEYEEADIIPYYFLKNNFLNLLDTENLNIILSTDKDLFQNMKISPHNIIQIINKRENGKFVTKIINNENAIDELIKKKRKNERINLVSNWISYFLSVGGDKSDNIPSVPRIGYKTFYNLLMKNLTDNELKEPDWNIIFSKIDEIKKYKELILKNFKLVDFETIISNRRVNSYLKNKIEKLI